MVALPAQRYAHNIIIHHSCHGASKGGEHHDQRISIRLTPSKRGGTDRINLESRNKAYAPPRTILDERGVSVQRSTSPLTVDGFDPLFEMFTVLPNLRWPSKLD